MATIFNVKDYGAVGNGRTDDTTALQAAIDAAAAAGGGTVYIPDGRYNVSTQSPGTVLVLKDNVHLQGQSRLVTIQLDEKTSTGDIDGIIHISGTNASAQNISVDGFTPYNGEVSAWSIGDGIKVTLDRISANNATGFGIDLRAEGSQVQLTNSRFDSNDGGGIVAAGLVNSTLSDDVVQDNGGTGLDVTGPLTVLDFASSYNSDGIVLHGDAQGRTAILQAGLSVSNGANGIVIDNAQGAVVDHLRVFENYRSGITVTNSENTRIVSNEITSDAQYGTWPEILLEDSIGTLVQGNTIGDQITSKAQRPTYGVEERGQSDANLIIDNFISGASDGEVKVVGAATRTGNTAVVMTTFGSAADDTISYYLTASNNLVYGGGGRDTLIWR